MMIPVVDHRIAKFAFEKSHELASQWYIVCHFTECADMALKSASSESNKNSCIAVSHLRTPLLAVTNNAVSTVDLERMTDDLLS